MENEGGFEYRLSDFSPGLLLAQAFLVPLLLFIGGGMAASAAIHATGLSISGYGTTALLGFALGYKAQRADERMAGSFGQWIWILPLAVEVWGMTSDGSAGHSLAVYFENVTGPGLTGSELFIGTFPLVSCCFYAAGITHAKSKQRKPPESQR